MPNKKMKTILIVTDNEPKQINGVVTTFNNIQVHAERDGYSVVYIDPRQFHHFNCPGYPEIKISWPWRIGQKIKAINPTHVHIATEGPIGLAANLWCWYHGWKFNTSYHTQFPEFLKKLYHIPEWITYGYLRWFHNHAGVILTTTNSMVKDLIAHGFKTNVISWTRGVDRTALSSTIEYTHNNAKPIVLYVGRVSKEKSLDDLCKLQDIYTINIVGDGPHRAKLESTYTKVNFLGYQQGSELANSYAQADVFCFPSRTDTFGIVIIEALSQGTPVAAYPVTGPIDILEQGITGYMDNDLNFAITQCLKLDRIVVKAKSTTWTWENCWKIFKKNLVILF